jgi:hypothetical protein
MSFSRRPSIHRLATPGPFERSLVAGVVNQVRRDEGLAELDKRAGPASRIEGDRPIRPHSGPLAKARP